MKYKIVEINPGEHSIVVRFYTEKFTEDMLATQKDDQGNVLRCRTDFSIDLPIPAPRNKALEDYIMQRAPFGWFKKLSDVADPAIDTSLEFLRSQLGVEKDGGTTPPIKVF